MSTTDRPQSSPWLALVAVIALAAGLIWLTHHRGVARADAARAALQQENEAMRAELSRLRAAAAPVVPPATSETPAPVAPAEQPAVVPVRPTTVLTPTGEAPPPRFDGLKLAGTHVVPVPEGLKATMRFTPTTTEPLGVVAVVVRLPRDGEARILDLGQAGGDAMSKLFKRVSEDGKFVVFQGTAEAISALEFGLTISGPATADIRGTCGIGPLSLNITAQGAVVE